MSKTIIDLSVSIRSDKPSDPPGFVPEIIYADHAAGAAQMASVFPGLSPEQLPEQEGWAVEFVKMSTHAGTHMDAPYHYHSKTDDKTPAMTIDQIPLEWCISSGVKLDFRNFDDGYIVTPADIDRELDRINYTLKEKDIVLINTSAGKRFGHEDYLEKGCGMGRDATLHLTKQGIKIVGTDAWSWDAPFSSTVKKFMETQDPSIIWEGHYAGSTVPYCHMEKMANLELLPSTGFTVICMPVKVHKGSAGWVRPVALLED
ncbi:cyclase family protein [Maridesulfovibrio salexigens DSM 2638]|uniref:Cyclase family protein n=2 Tax=Maridesulfovibrio salexigens TaxID=880 RepID=C6BWM0_MARSD|nr:cyclase family protein [Maridesulfovibrio salexigens DSM 2638]